MQPVDIQYTKLRWLLTIGGLLLYVGDVGTDIGLAVRYFQKGDSVWARLTLAFVLAGLLVTQIFSYAWYEDDMNDVVMNAVGKPTVSGPSKGSLVVLHLSGVGIFSRYHHLLKRGFQVVWTSAHSNAAEERQGADHAVFCMATDLSMLKLFETFLESVPQLLLQLYIVLGHGGGSVLQYLSMASSFFNIAWSLVDYRRCLRRSLAHIGEMPSGLPTAIYLLYKLCTITSHILSYTLLLVLSPYSAIGLTVLSLLGTAWTHVLQTNFCSSRKLELLYRAVIGVILTFTFFNVKGQDTKVHMAIYYSFHVFVNVSAPLLLGLLKPASQTEAFLLTVSGLIFAGSALGLCFLVLYYLFLHPKEKWREADELDGGDTVDGAVEGTQARQRRENFLRPG
ncbi:XK-related protein 9 [Spinachia spinachia]